MDWLKNYVKIEVPLPRLIDKLNMIGLLVEEWEEREGDVILDIETYANRPDTLGHLGVAREIAAAFGVPLKEPNWPLTEIEEKTSELVDIQIWDEDLCPRYCGIIIRDIKVGPSPKWLRKMIEGMGLRPINNVVDATNYVLFSTAHPIHAFDLKKISGEKIIVRRAKKGEVIRSLESEDIHLSQEMLVIADEEKPIALAGVIGGEEAAVSEYTRHVFIESAYFDPISVRKTSKNTGVSTDASYRFEREADISFPPHAALMTASLLCQLGGKATKDIVDVYPKRQKSKTIKLRLYRISELLGLEIDKSFTQKTLSDLGFGVKMEQRGVLEVKVPFFRVDVEREADLIEEIARFYGYDKIPAQIPPLRELGPSLDKKKKKVERLRQVLFHHGFDEVVNFSFFDPEKEAKFRTSRKAIKIRNPVSSKASLLRTTLIGGLLENIVWNKNRGTEGIHAFEMGNVYFWENETCREQFTLGLVTTGYIGTSCWQAERQKTDFFHIKGTCEALMVHLRYEPFSFRDESHPFFQKEYSLSLSFIGKRIGYLGLLKQEILDSYSLDDNVWAVELNLASLFEKQPQSFRFAPLIKFPGVSRDISFVTNRSVPYQDVKEAIEKLSIPYLEKFDLYDRFSGSSVPKDKVSLSFRFVFRHPQRTLLAEEVDNLQQRIINFLGASFNFQLREGGKIDK